MHRPYRLDAEVPPSVHSIGGAGETVAEVGRCRAVDMGMPLAATPPWQEWTHRKGAYQLAGALRRREARTGSLDQRLAQRSACARSWRYSSASADFSSSTVRALASLQARRSSSGQGIW